MYKEGLYPRVNRFTAGATRGRVKDNARSVSCVYFHGNEWTLATRRLYIATRVCVCMGVCEGDGKCVVDSETRLPCYEGGKCVRARGK